MFELWWWWWCPLHVQRSFLYFDLVLHFQGVCQVVGRLSTCPHVALALLLWEMLIAKVQGSTRETFLDFYSHFTILVLSRVFLLFFTVWRSRVKYLRKHDGTVQYAQVGVVLKCSWTLVLLLLLLVAMDDDDFFLLDDMYGRVYTIPVGIFLVEKEGGEKGGREF